MPAARLLLLVGVLLLAAACGGPPAGRSERARIGQVAGGQAPLDPARAFVKQDQTREAQRLGRIGGKVSPGGRKGDREWGRRAQRQRAARAQKAHYPGLVKLWEENVGRTRWGYPTVLVPTVGRWRTEVEPRTHPSRANQGGAP